MPCCHPLRPSVATRHMRHWLLACTTLLASSLPIVAAAEEWPRKPIKIVVPVAPGGVMDLAARLLAPRLAHSLGQAVVVDNQAGADTALGMSAVARSPADGHTWLLAPSSSLTNIPLLKNVGYAPLKDFAAVAPIGYVSQVFLTSPALGARSMGEFIALARSRPGAFNYAHAGSGTVGQLNAYLLQQAAGIAMVPINYKGGASTLTDLMANRVQLAVIPSAAATPLVRSGKLVPLGVVGKGRSPMLADVPTLEELGLPGVNLVGWVGVLMPAGTPQAIVLRANALLSTIVSEPAVQEQLRQIDVTATPAVSPEAFAAQIRTEVRAMPGIFDAAGIQGEDGPPRQPLPLRP